MLLINSHATAPLITQTGETNVQVVTVLISLQGFMRPIYENVRRNENITVQAVNEFVVHKWLVYFIT
jgi:hypothetical protein